MAAMAGTFTLSAQAQWLEPSALMDWAQQQYPALFPEAAPNQTAAPYTYRAYSSGHLLGVAEGFVYLYGPATQQQIQRLETLAAFQCEVYPARCTTPVSGIAAANLRYGQTAILTLVGQDVSRVSNVSVTRGKCATLQQLSGVISRAMRVSCGVIGTGALTVEAKDASGQVLGTASFTVPEPQVRLNTRDGELVLQLNPTAAPVSARNFLNYVNSGFYTGTLFHRVIPGFVAQGGGFTTGMVPKAPTSAPIVLESNNGLSNLRGTLAMARTASPDSATSQFYVNLVDNTGLNYVDTNRPGYAVFGAVVSGLDLLDRLATQPTTTVNGNQNVPVTELVVESASQIQ